MNRIINIFTFLILAVFCFMVLVLVYDLALSNLHLKGMPYKLQIFTGLALSVFFLGLIRVQRRWQGMRDMKKYSNFSYVTFVAKTHRYQAVLITSMEILFFVAVILFCRLFLNLNPEYVMPMILVLTFICLESGVFIYRLIKGGNSFRVGLNNDVIARFDREMSLYYYTGLQRVELHQKDLLNFGYRDGLNLSFPTESIALEDRKAFRDALIAVLETKNVYIDDSVRTWN